MLPEWARPHALAATQEHAPAEADAWVLLDRTEFAYTGRGEIAIQRLRLVRVLTEKALGQGTYFLGGLGGKASRVKSLKGWNLRPDGEVERIAKENTVVVASGDGNITGTFLTRVGRGSLVAWQSLQLLQSPMGPIGEVRPLEEYPVRRWELELAKREGWFADLKQVRIQMDLRGFAPWIVSPEIIPGQSVKLSNLEALPSDEEAYPHPRDYLPRVVLRFLDPELSDLPSLEQGWDSLARWFAHRYEGSYNPFPSTLSGTGLAQLQAIRKLMREQLVYKQFYLSPERGWIPEMPVEVGRKRYGDCKDLALFLIASARSSGFQAFPALCRIAEGSLGEDEPISPYAFNHVIAAVKLEASLGLASEVETPQGRFLLMDLTERYNPVGQLGEAHLGRRVMICTDKGALWVHVPDQGIVHPAVQVLQKGEVNLFGRLKCTLTVQETGNALGLRSEFQEGGASALKDYLLLRLLDLPPDGALDVVSQGDPLDVQHPFEVVFRVELPEVLQVRGGECLLPGFLFPGIPGQIQKMGRARRLPVQSPQGILVECESELKVGVLLQPVLPQLRISTPLRQLAWSVRAEPLEMGGCVVRWTLKNQRMAASFPIPEQEKGAQAWKQDRSSMQKLFRDGLAFKVPADARP
jgi:hypothetical protein